MGNYEARRNESNTVVATCTKQTDVSLSLLVLTRDTDTDGTAYNVDKAKHALMRPQETDGQHKVKEVSIEQTISRGW